MYIACERGFQMTRTILNWSELLNQYQSKCKEDPKRLKKWSDFSEPERKKPIPEIHEEQMQNKSTHENISEFDTKPAHIKEITISDHPENLNFSDEDNIEQLTEIDDQSGSFNDLVTENRDTPQPKATILELFYDCMMQDTESIPALYEKYCGQNNKDLI